MGKSDKITNPEQNEFSESLLHYFNYTLQAGVY
jgi:hypothetical protein